jgi:hypothetical protein
MPARHRGGTAAAAAAAPAAASTGCGSFCGDCGGDLAASAFCPNTGKAHEVPAAAAAAVPACPLCELTTPFCPVSGKPHNATALRQDAAKRRHAANHEALKLTSTVLHPTDEQIAQFRRQATEETQMAMITKKAGPSLPENMRRRIPEKDLQQLKDDGYGIFAPGNPAMEKVDGQGQPKPARSAQQIADLLAATAPNTVADKRFRLDMPPTPKGADGGGGGGGGGRPPGATADTSKHFEQFMKQGPAGANKTSMFVKALMVCVLVLLCMTVFRTIMIAFDPPTRPRMPQPQQQGALSADAEVGA